MRFHLARYKRHHAIRRAWHYYRTHPLPDCTWVGESGGNYWAKNPGSTAGGKYQVLDSTWASFGGSQYALRWDAAYAPKLEQEKVARRIAWWGFGPHPPQGLSAWVNC